jgi:5-methyltetrahydrofolate--homocysteine methyltransferase
MQEMIKQSLNKVESSVPTTVSSTVSYQRSSQVELFKDHPAPDYQQHTIKNSSIDEIFHYINPLMLYGRHLGIKGKIVKLLSSGQKELALKEMQADKANEIFNTVEQLKKQYKKSHLIPAATYRFFYAQSKDNNIYLFNEQHKELAILPFPRQHREDGLCLADYVSPLGDDHFSTIALFVVTVGRGIKEEVERLKQQGEYLNSHALAALALESAEGYAELIHSKLRAQLGFTDPIDITMLERFQAKYQGKRYSFGYPACPDLDNQKIIFNLLQVESEIGVQLTEGNMMEPEASVSAIVFQHPQASYFSVGANE